MNEPKKLIILLVEDTNEHALLVERGLEEGLLNYRLFWVKDGEEALDFLYNNAGYADGKEYPRPDIILLDLRLPKVSGVEVLEKISSEEKLKDIPVVVLTVSDQVEDIFRSCRAGARSYILKPIAIASKMGGVRGIIDAIVSLV